MNRKIGIVSLYYRSYNYGGVLQAYAMCRLVNAYGFQAEQIVYAKTKDAAMRMKRLRSKSPARVIRRSAEQVMTKLCDLGIKKAEIQLRRAAFDTFKKAHIPSSKVYTTETIEQACGCYDGFICGSDQVWNPNSIDNIYALNFVPSYVTKFSYAASLSAPIPPQKKPFYMDMLRNLDGVSVREASARQELSDMTEKSVELVLDPTLLLDREEWEKISAERVVPEPYIFCYFLGSNADIRRLAANYAGKMGIKIVTLPYIGPVHTVYDRFFGEERLYDVGPEKFLALIRDAECVLTDSFHAVALSHVFERPFWAFRRKTAHKKEDRVLSLLFMSGLEDRFVDQIQKDTVEKMEHSDIPDFQKANHRLKKMKEQSAAYLHRCLDGVEQRR